LDLLQFGYFPILPVNREPFTHVHRRSGSTKRSRRGVGRSV